MDKKREEREFFDQDAVNSPRDRIRQYYAIAKEAHQHYRKLCLRDCAGLKVLEIGCGLKAHAFPLVAGGASVTGIDIAPRAVAALRDAARESNTPMHLLVMDAEELSFRDASFDLVIGSGILHHLDLPRIMAEIHRVLRPGGRAVFLEPLGHNPFLNAFRRLTPHLRTSDEHPLVRSDLRQMARFFPRHDYRFFHLCSFLAIPFLPTPIFWPVLGFLDGLDRVLFRVVSPLRYWGWYATIELFRE